MSRLNKVVNARYKKSKKSAEQRVPEFDSSGKAVKVGNTELKNRIGLAILIVTGIIVLLYFPGFFMKDKKENSNVYPYTPDTSSIKVFKDYVAQSKTKDFDEDSLDYATEQSYSTNSWDIDTDFDGISDYYEIYITKTSPSEYDSGVLEEMQQKEDQEKKVTLDVPYKCGNVILWADDYTSKAKGGVVETPKGYHFTNFKGYAQFPNEEKIYAYTNDSGSYKPLEYLEDSNVWKIDGVHNVEIFSSPIKEVTEYSFFGKKTYSEHGFFGAILTFLLPEKGWLTAKKTTLEDVEPTSTHPVYADNFNISYNTESGERFKQKTNSLKDLQYVRSMIDENRCVAVSLFNSKDGEIRGLIYGYDDNNTLFVANEETHEPLGAIKVDEIGIKGVSPSGEYGLITYFKWKGLGYNSEWHNNISFFAVANDPSNLMVKEEPKEEATPLDALEATPNDASVTDASKSDAPYDYESDENYELPVLTTGNWNHTRDGFTDIMANYTSFTGNTENITTDDKYKDFHSNGEINSLTSFKDKKNNIVTYFWVTEHIKAKDIYKQLIDAYNQNGTISEKTDEVYKETTVTYEDGTYTIIRKYTDDTFIVYDIKSEWTDELTNIDADLGLTEAETTE